MLTIEHSGDGRSVTVTLNRPDRRNALNHTLVTELTTVLQGLYADSQLRVIILTGAGNVFSAGADLQALKQLQSASFDENLLDSKALAVLFQTMMEGPKLLVARVNGHAIAGGSGLVSACDISIASESAKFGFTEVRLGFVPALVSVLLRNRISEADLRDVLLSGRLFSASDAVKMGLINQSVPDKLLDTTVNEYVESICRNTSMEAIERTKALLFANSGKDFESAMHAAIRGNAQARSSEDCQAGIHAFLEKRAAPWATAYDNDHPEPA
jgi:methylglutaconyl-CoA hydratase